ncbi:MAG: hypothetical protein AAGD14_10910 [Planctomycetota bacterium]
MIRFGVIFLVAAMLSAITVSGQDEDGPGLRERIRQLTEDLEAQADARRRPDGNDEGKDHVRVVRRTYDVRDLVRPRRERRERLFELLPSNYQPPEEAEFPEDLSSIDLDSLIDMIRTTIEPASWETVENADIQVRAGHLMIHTIPRVQGKVEAFLDRVRRFVDRELKVEILAVPVEPGDDALFGNRPRELTEPEATAMRARTSLGRALLQGASGKAMAHSFGRNIAYLSDYDVNIAQEATIGNPITSRVFHGTIVNVIAMWDDGGQGARLDVELSRTSVAQPMRRVDTEHGPLELATMELTRVQSSAWYPLGKTCVIGGGLAGDTPCLFLVKVTRKPQG